jgi:hypothetical protein
MEQALKRVSGCINTDFIFGIGGNFLFILRPSDDWCRITYSTALQLNSVSHCGQYACFLSNYGRRLKILAHSDTSIWNTLYL